MKGWGLCDGFVKGVINRARSGAPAGPDAAGHVKARLVCKVCADSPTDAMSCRVRSGSHINITA